LEDLFPLKNKGSSKKKSRINVKLIIIIVGYQHIQLVIEGIRFEKNSKGEGVMQMKARIR
jgi:hypothetical protein